MKYSVERVKRDQTDGGCVQGTLCPSGNCRNVRPMTHLSHFARSAEHVVTQKVTLRPLRSPDNDENQLTTRVYALC